MKRKKPDLTQQWERLMRQREQTIAKLCRIEAKAAKLRKQLARRTNKKAKPLAGIVWPQEPIDGLTDLPGEEFSL